MSTGSLYGSSSWAPPAVVVEVVGGEVLDVEVEVLEVGVLEVDVELVVEVAVEDVVCAAEGSAPTQTTVTEKSATAYHRRRGRVLTRPSVARRHVRKRSLPAGFAWS